MALQPFSRRRVSDIRIDRFDDTVPVLTSRAEFAGEIAKLWADAHQRFILIGRHLTQAKQVLPHGEYIAMIERDLPFSRFVAHQLRAVAEAIDAGALPTDYLPNSYSTVYQIVTLAPEERAKALAENIIRPDMRRAELIEFKRRLRAGRTKRRATLECERDRIVNDIQRLKERLREIDAELGGTVIDTVAEEA